MEPAGGPIATSLELMLASQHFTKIDGLWCYHTRCHHLGQIVLHGPRHEPSSAAAGSGTCTFISDAWARAGTGLFVLFVILIAGTVSQSFSCFISLRVSYGKHYLHCCQQSTHVCCCQEGFMFFVFSLALPHMSTQARPKALLPPGKAVGTSTCDTEASDFPSSSSSGSLTE